MREGFDCESRPCRWWWLVSVSRLKCICSRMRNQLRSRRNWQHRYFDSGDRECRELILKKSRRRCDRYAGHSGRQSGLPFELVGDAETKTVVRLGYYEDETFDCSDWHFPAAHYLESWGDAVTSDGTLVPIQPLIQPLFGGLTELEFLARIAGEAQTNPLRNCSGNICWFR